MHGGVAKDDLKHENVAAVNKGCENLKRHIENMNQFGVPVVVAINKFITDTDAEVQEVMKAAESMGTRRFFARIGPRAVRAPKHSLSIVVELSTPAKRALQAALSRRHDPAR